MSLRKGGELILIKDYGPTWFFQNIMVCADKSFKLNIAVFHKKILS